MSFYNNIQKKLSELSDAKKQYWEDLESRINYFQDGLITYLGVKELVLYDSKDKSYPIVVVGTMKGDSVEKAPGYKMERVEGEINSLHFYVQVNLSKANSEILDSKKILKCFIWRRGDDYFVNVEGVEVKCIRKTSTNDFTLAYDRIYKNLENHLDKKSYE
ncbi:MULTISPECIES: hypothetical protein [Enterobacteriaceae]|uniref:hypothetical protein n=1 Tax=Enterobacteriaceae TaxID=543 RepID=UPI0028A9299A|nr:hypothetical protein [Kosakonia cowanii]